MKKLFLVALLAIISIGAYAQKGQGNQQLGFNIGYAFDSENATLGVDYRYNITDAIRFNPGVTYFTKNDGLSAWAIDMNLHYVVPLGDSFSFYPLAGLDLSFWKFGHKDYSDNATRFGANIGLGGEFYATSLLTVGVDLKYNIIKDFDQAMFAVRVGYNF